MSDERKTCKYCGTGNLLWIRTAFGYVLMESDGSRKKHDCRQKFQGDNAKQKR